MNIWIKNNLFLIGILIGAFVLRFWGITTTEIQSDIAVYAVRAMDWFDFLSAGSQTSPVVWYGYTPWWANLSFHDHPPLVFALLWLSIKAFGDNSFAVILPSALAGLLTVLVVYFTALKFKGKKEALLTALLLTVTSLAVWASRTGFLEGVESLFIALAIFFGLKYIHQKKTKDLLYWSATVGLAVISKYTALFLIPAFLSYFLLYDRKFFTKIKSYLAVLPFLVVSLPVIIYNYIIFKDRGHFDAALSSMLGLKPEAFLILNREIEKNPVTSLNALVDSFTGSMSWLFLILVLLSALYIVYLVISKRADFYEKFLILNTSWLFILFIFLPAAPRFIPIWIPVLVLILARAFYRVYVSLAKNYQKILASIFILAIAIEAVYGFNSHVLTTSASNSSFLKAKNTFTYQGYVELDNYLRENAYGELTRRERITEITEEIQGVNIAGRDVIIFDERTSWSRGLWYVNRYQHYYNAPILSLTEIVASIGDEDLNVFEFLSANGVTGYWVVIAHNEARDEEAGFEFRSLMDQVEALIQDSNIAPVKEIRNPNGQLLFSIYNFRLGNSQN